MKFSARTEWDLEDNAFAALLRNARTNNRELLDLTVSNPTACGFAYDATGLLEPLSAVGALRYEPEPLGMERAREAVAAYYSDPDKTVPVEHICMTTSTSEAYSFLFRLLCDPGDEVLIARPSYPLFEFIARLDDVRLVEYPLLYQDGWHIDLHALEAAITPCTRAVVVVHPNNPTGNFASQSDRTALDKLCADRGLALLVDEVFLDYALPGQGEPSFVQGKSKALTFVLSGLSKICALPQMKLSWIVACGPAEDVVAAMGRLEVIADTYLSVSAPTQFALSGWLTGRGPMQEQIRSRMQANLQTLDRRLCGSHANRLVMAGGWTVVLRVPRTVNGVSFAEATLAAGVVVQPGEFYGLPEGRVILSLLTPPDAWESGLDRLPVA